MKNFKELNIWKQGILLVKLTFQISKRFPPEEKFGITMQMTRSAVSIPANIAEGSGRSSDKDYTRFLRIALGSAFELQTYFEIAKELRWISYEEILPAENLLEQEIKMTYAFIRSINSKMSESTNNE
jgi:four helix bundle protein